MSYNAFKTLFGKDALVLDMEEVPQRMDEIQGKRVAGIWVGKSLAGLNPQELTQKLIAFEAILKPKGLIGGFLKYGKGMDSQANHQYTLDMLGMIFVKPLEYKIANFTLSRVEEGWFEFVFKRTERKSHL